MRDLLVDPKKKAFMAEIVNLRKVRKRTQRTKAAERAAENRVLYGTPKAQRALVEAQKNKADKALDQHRLDTGDGE